MDLAPPRSSLNRSISHRGHILSLTACLLAECSPLSMSFIASLLLSAALNVPSQAQAARRASEGERPASAGPGTLVGAASATGSQIEVRLSGGGSRVLRPPELTPSPRVPAKSDPEKNTNEHAVKIVLKEQKVRPPSPLVPCARLDLTHSAPIFDLSPASQYPVGCCI